MNQIAALLERTVVMDDNSNWNLVLTDEPANTAKVRVAWILTFRNRVIDLTDYLPVGDRSIERSALALADVVVRIDEETQDPSHSLSVT
jgi:hypothetical protein